MPSVEPALDAQVTRRRPACWEARKERHVGVGQNSCRLVSNQKNTRQTFWLMKKNEKVSCKIL